MANRYSYSVLHIVQRYRNWQKVSLIFHKAPQEEVEEVSDSDIMASGNWIPVR
jgi:hypothetical protein